MTQKPIRLIHAKGFALIVTLSLMILLTVIAVGLLSLSAISLRSSATGEAQARAAANARLAVILAIGELQKETGDDRRITADASLFASARQSHLVGTWSSWTPGFDKNPDQSAPDYTKPKTDLFRSWLVSAPDPSVLKMRKWAETNVDSSWIRLFSVTRNGFDLSAPLVAVPKGAYAWAVSQENTKAKVNVAGPETESGINTALQVQRRPSLALAATLKQPAGGWNLRANRVVSLDQVALDSELVSNSATLPTAGASFTTHAQGLLTDVVKGGLKVDLNLGFEMADSDFNRASWSGTPSPTPNPFRSPNVNMGFSSPGSYEGQRALFRPLVDSAIVSNITDYGAVKVTDRFLAAGVPTFDHLRSHYRMPHHLYGGTSPTVAWRGADHVAAKSIGRASSSPAKPPSGDTSSLAIRPILNRMVYLLSVKFVRSAGATSPIKIRLVLTPVIALWNPYNTALEMQGAYAFPWMDLPFQMTWKKNNSPAGDFVLAMMLAQNDSIRQEGPYFRCELSADDSGDLNKAIRFEPGEVRVFVPSLPVPTLFNRSESLAKRSVKMRPVADVQDLNLTGGFEIPMEGGVYGKALPALRDTDKITLKIDTYQQSGQGFHYFVSLVKADAIDARQQAISDVQVLNLSSVSLPESAPMHGSALLSAPPQPYAVIETFHRTAKTVDGSSNSDLLYTTNPRQASINHQLAAGSFSVAPHYQSTLRAVASFDGAIQTSFDGRRSFWGATSSPPEGKDQLTFFEIPREPTLSLASFQSADLASSAFSSANQFANSWASPYLGLAKTASANSASIPGMPVYDTPYLTNEALWDGFFFSGAAPTLRPAPSGNPATAWGAPIANVERPLRDVVAEFVKDPAGKPLSNSRMRLEKAGLADDDLVKRLLDPEGCTRIAAHLSVDGAFNVNSTDVEAWTALLAGLRGEAFKVQGGTPSSSSQTAFPRFRHPAGKTDDNWNGFRALNDSQIRILAQNIVSEIRLRGPFLSLGEFINRRVENSALGKSGAIQAAIDTGKLNEQSKQESFSTNKYPSEAKNHIIADTGVGIPGYLTQADVLQSLAPMITVRSDTFTIRGYGEARDAAGKVIARNWCEAVVQRTPKFMDPTDAADAAIASITPTNQTFGRRFEIISFRQISPVEIR